MCKKSIVIAVFLIASCSHSNIVEQEQKRRANLELQSVMDMVISRQIPPVDFEFNSAVLKPSSYELLDKVYQILSKYPKLKLIVEGHTDDIGSDEYNDKLSLMRADAVKAYLVKKGIHPDSIRIYGYGKRKPIVKGNTDAARALNRRVEFKITTRDWESVY